MEPTMRAVGGQTKGVLSLLGRVEWVSEPTSASVLASLGSALWEGMVLSDETQCQPGNNPLEAIPKAQQTQKYDGDKQHTADCYDHSTQK
jgi:hypothetical protein